MKKNKKIVIGAGGTGGHLFPASAIKKALEKRGYTIYLITDIFSNFDAKRKPLLSVIR